jgi:hypothetical protein
VVSVPALVSVLVSVESEPSIIVSALAADEPASAPDPELSVVPAPLVPLELDEQSSRFSRSSR